MDNVHRDPPSLNIDLSGERPIMEQITNGLRQRLVQRDLRPGDRLPSSRALARDLGVHFNTVAQAYRTLESEGWLALRRRSGTVVTERAAPQPDQAESRQLEQGFLDELETLLARYEAEGMERAAIRDRVNRILSRGEKSS